MLEFERHFWGRGFHRLAGVDEAGRGPLAGPVVAAAVVFDREFAEREENGLLKGLNDSKKLTRQRREFFFRILVRSDFADIGVGFSDVDEIDTLNILRATHRAMGRAVRSLACAPDHVLLDGRPVPGLPCAFEAIVGGDGKSLSIAAASVVAKVVRDDYMADVHAMYPQYGFAEHKGYGSKVHMAALLEYGPAAVHRRSFRPVREAEEIRRRMSAGTGNAEQGTGNGE